MKFLFFLCFSLSLIFLFNAKAFADEEDTEAGFNYDTKMNSDFCCDRSQKSESAHELSDEESRRRVNQVLYSPSSKPSSQPPAGKGQR